MIGLHNDRVVRALGAHERLLYLYSKDHHRHFCVVGELSGKFTVLELGRAIHQVQKCHPNLSLAVQHGDAGPYFVEHSRLIPIEMHWKSGVACWRDFVEDELATPFTPSPGPLLRIKVVRDLVDQTRHAIILTFHHAVADGLSAVAFLDDVAAVLNGLQPPVAPNRLAIEDLVRDRQIICHNEKNDDDSSSARSSNRDDLLEIAGKPLWRSFDHDRPRVGALQLSEGLTQALVVRSREQATSVHGALCSALTLTHAPAHTSEKFTTLSPINIRPSVDVSQREIGLFLTVSAVQIPTRVTHDFWNLARTFSKEIAKAREEKCVLESVAKIEHALPNTASVDLARGVIGSLAYDAVLSNLGRLSPASSGEVATLDAVWGPMVLGRLRDERMIGAATLNGQLRLTEARPDHVPEGLVRMAAQLAKACDLIETPS